MHEKQRTIFSWHVVGGKAYVVAYDVVSGHLLSSVVEYAIWLTDKMLLDAKTVKNEITFLRSFFEFMGGRGLTETNDSTVIAYRDAELKRVVGSRNSSGSERTAKRTVNQKLRQIYRFLEWCQDNEYVPSGTLGAKRCALTVPARNRALGISGGSTRWRSIGPSIPTLYRRVGESSRIRQGYFATEADISNIRKFFSENCSEFTYIRNVLMMDIACEAGWRRGSIASLTCTQFLRLAEVSDPTLNRVVPSDQKFGYEFDFQVSPALVARVLSYIHTVRQPLLDEMNWGGHAGDALFISARNGRPLARAALSTVFGRALRGIGAPFGAGLHAFRRRFAERCIEEELRERLRFGLDTSAASVTAAVALRMGHVNPASLEVYVSRAHSSMLANSGGALNLAQAPPESR